MLSGFELYPRWVPLNTIPLLDRQLQLVASKCGYETKKNVRIEKFLNKNSQLYSHNYDQPQSLLSHSDVL